MGLLRRNRTDSLERVTEMVEEYELPTFPQVAAAALRELADPEVDLRAVAAMLERDPGLSVRLLRLANSAALGLRSSVDSLDRAVAMLGRNQVESILIGQAVRRTLRTTSPVVDEQRFWATAAMRAVVAAQLARLLDPPRRSEHFTAALLQDMAILVLADRVPRYESVLEAWYGGGVDDLSDAEIDAFGWDHAAVGAAMCRSWQFPDNLVEAVASHHVAEPRTPSQLVHAWHETDDQRGPDALRLQAAAVTVLEGRIDEILDVAREEAVDLATAFE